MSLTEYVANFTLELQHEDIPESVRARAIEHILDGYGLTLSGQDEKAHTIMLRYARRVSCAEEVQVLGTGVRSSSAWKGYTRKDGTRKRHFPPVPPGAREGRRPAPTQGPLTLPR